MEFRPEWGVANGVRSAELRGTWAELEIHVGDTCATLVEDAEGIVRKAIRVSAYPLAEWLAYGWWRILAPAGHSAGFSIAGAGDGFAWPDMVLCSGPGYMLATVEKANRPEQSVRFLASGSELMDPVRGRDQIQAFITATVERLESEGLHDTPLQAEWSAILETDGETEAFCLTAAAMGLDPYDLSEEQMQVVLSLGQGISDASLVADLAAVTSPSEAGTAHGWALAALAGLSSNVGARAPLDLAVTPLFSHGNAYPWKAGYDRARQMRERLGLAEDVPMDLGDLVAVVDVSDEAPEGLVALAGVRSGATVAAVPSWLSQPARRFAAARALGRRTFDDRENLVLSRGVDYATKVERAFAAEFLAPAHGIEHFVRNEGDPVEAAAHHFGVSPVVIERQMENQLGRGGL